VCTIAILEDGGNERGHGGEADGPNEWEMETLISNGLVPAKESDDLPKPVF
jgi:hypothetical protein